jgi:hypothetical protein
VYLEIAAMANSRSPTREMLRDSISKVRSLRDREASHGEKLKRKRTVEVRRVGITWSIVRETFTKGAGKLSEKWDPATS